jgi:hypothetical protein
VNRGRAQGAVIDVRPVRTRFHKADILPSSVTFAKALRGPDSYEFLWQFAQVPVFSYRIFSFFTYAAKELAISGRENLLAGCFHRLATQPVRRDTRAQLPYASGQPQIFAGGR